MNIKGISSIIGGMALRRSGHADQESGPVGAPSGAGRKVPARLKPHLPRVFELIQSMTKKQYFI
ncbi:MAG: hypothetical protein COX16_16775 [Deltaproteobacteria bacterium CG23_combo_of_CG06-09_8_20_14_all_51_20]|nr:MAG: hypothetical protein COX16_16775 [Deltaproteobacteria bacterium CG23_combo_of_CG06-09_8_20_14_all_51_20]PIV99799.1 MAG: hypothetical protein COW41_07020 [Deltaproteobacteria bacterium CG17_big_fil_post_rev_8_21_14_2_50_51_6]